MPSNASNPTQIFASRKQVTAALVRAAERAPVIAEQTGTKLVVVQPPAQTPLPPPVKSKETP